jgi:hypothetical protein
MHFSFTVIIYREGGGSKHAFCIKTHDIIELLGKVSDSQV